MTSDPDAWNELSREEKLAAFEKHAAVPKSPRARAVLIGFGIVVISCIVAAVYNDWSYHAGQGAAQRNDGESIASAVARTTAIEKRRALEDGIARANRELSAAATYEQETIKYGSAGEGQSARDYQTAALKLALAQLDLHEFDATARATTPEQLATIRRDYDHRREVAKLAAP